MNGNPLGSTGSGVLQQLQQLLQNSQSQQAPVTSALDQNQVANQQNTSQQMGNQQPNPSLPSPRVQQADYTGGMGGRIKNTLTNFFYGVGQGMLKEAGLPTDYQKQQQSIQNNQKQQQLDQSKQEIGSLIQLHQGQLQQEQFEQAPVSLPEPIAQQLGIQSVARKDFPAAIQAYGAIAQNAPSVTLPAGLEHLGFTAGQQVSPKQLANATKVNGLLNSGWKQGQSDGQDFFYNPVTGQKIMMGQDDKIAAAGISAAAGIARVGAMANQRVVQTVDPHDPTNLIYQHAGDAVSQGASAPGSIPYSTAKSTARSFTSGSNANTLNSFNTAISHLGQLSSVADALGNGNTQLLNRFSQGYAQQTGEPAPTNFDAVKNAVAGEISKTFKGGQATDAEVQMMNGVLSRAQSPQQLKGVVDTFTKLMNSKRDALKAQYQQGMQGKPNFTGEGTPPPAPQSPAKTGSYWDQFPVRKTP